MLVNETAELGTLASFSDTPAALTRLDSTGTKPGFELPKVWPYPAPLLKKLTPSCGHFYLLLEFLL